MKKATSTPVGAVTQEEALRQVEALRAQDIVATRKRSGALSNAELEWLENESRTYQRPSSALSRVVDPAAPTIPLEYRRRSLVDKKKLNKMIAELKAAGHTTEKIQELVEQATKRGELEADDSVSHVRQHRENVAFARSEGVDLANAIVFAEDGSAYLRKHRPEFTAMMKWIESFEGNNPVVLYTYELSRLFRNQDVAEATLATLRRKSVTLRIVTQPQIRLDDEMSALFLPMLVQFAVNESKMTSKRTTGGQKDRAKLGSVRTSTAALGLTTTKAQTEKGVRSVYIPDRTPREDYPNKQSSAWLIEQIYSRYETGDSATAICQWLNDSKFPTTKASCWYENTVMAILRNPHYAGYIRHNEKQANGKRLPRTAVREQIVKNEDGTMFEAFEPIIARDRWWQIQALLDHRYRPRGPQRTVHRLAGIVYCGRCDGKMFGQSKDGKSQAYRCPHSFRNSTAKVKANTADVVCVANNILAEGLDVVVYRLATRIIGNPNLFAEISSRPAVTIEVDEGARNALLAKIEQYEKMLADETDPDARAGYKAMLASATDRLSKMNADQQIAVQIGHKALGSVSEFDAMWRSNDKTAIIMCLRALIDKIVVDPISDKRMNRRSLDNKGWLCDYSRVTIVWANGSKTQLEQAFTAGEQALNAS